MSEKRKDREKDEPTPDRKEADTAAGGRPGDAPETTGVIIHGDDPPPVDTPDEGKGEG